LRYFSTSHISKCPTATCRDAIQCLVTAAIPDV
jgi:hypothetical protein